MKILVTGACGYKGSILVPKLLARGDIIIALDSMWFGNYLKPHPNLSVIKGDVREAKSVPLDGIDAIIHLASVANDPCGDLDPKLTWEVSALATMTLADRAARKGIKRFIYASSGSVYGVKEEERVTEDLELEPISEYNKTKMVAERILLSYANEMIVQIVRPATVCGWSPRMRLDVSVNMLTMQALTNGKITVFGGLSGQAEHPHSGHHRRFTSSCSIAPSARRLQCGLREPVDHADRRASGEHDAAEVTVTPSNDPRSYRVELRQAAGDRLRAAQDRQ